MCYVSKVWNLVGTVCDVSNVGNLVGTVWDVSKVGILVGTVCDLSNVGNLVGTVCDVSNVGNLVGTVCDVSKVGNEFLNGIKCCLPRTNSIQLFHFSILRYMYFTISVYFTKYIFKCFLRVHGFYHTNFHIQYIYCV